MDAIFALILIVYILSAVVQAVLGKDARKRQRGAGAPWPGTYPPGKTLREEPPIPRGFPIPLPFPFEDASREESGEDLSQGDSEYEDMTLESMEDDEKEKVRPWEDKTWGSLGPSLEGQSLEEPERDEFYDLQVADDFDDMTIDDDIADFVVPAEPPAFERMEFGSKSAVIQGIIMSEVLKRPKAFSRYPVIRN